MHSLFTEGNLRSSPYGGITGNPSGAEEENRAASLA